jgi:hypothetical protein
VRYATKLIEYDTTWFTRSEILTCANAVVAKLTCFHVVITKRNAFACIRFTENMIVTCIVKNDPDDKLYNINGKYKNCTKVLRFKGKSMVSKHGLLIGIQNIHE